MGPRIGSASWPGGLSIPAEMTFTPFAAGGMIMSWTFVGAPVTPSIRGTECP